MKAPRPTPRLRAAACLTVTTLALCSLVVQAAVTLDNSDAFIVAGPQTGDLTIAGDLSVAKGIDFGTATLNPALAAAQINYFGNTVNAVMFDLTACGSFQWRDNLVATARNKMKLDSNSILTLYKSDGTAGVTLNANKGWIDLSGANNRITAGGIPLFACDASGNLQFGNRPLIVTNATAASSSSTGALAVAGGIGVSMDSYINGIRIGRGGGNVESNTAYGMNSLQSNTSGFANTAAGYNSLSGNTTGIANVAIGSCAGTYQANGSSSLSAPKASIYIGANCRGFSNLDNHSIVIGCAAIGEGANTTVIGSSNTLKTHLYGTVTASKFHVRGSPQLPLTIDNQDEALVVDGNTRLKGRVIIEQAQGDISMGIYGP